MWARPMSPVNMMRRVVPFSRTSSCTNAEPRMWPASWKVSVTPLMTSRGVRYLSLLKALSVGGMSSGV